MPKRRLQNPDDFFNDDDPIGLTGAFAPVKGPQSVDYDVQDDPVGLTQAFGAVTVDEDERSWTEAEKWKGFDWDEGRTGDIVNGTDDEAAEALLEAEGVDAEDAAIEAANDEVEDFLDDADPVVAREESPRAAEKAAKRSRHERQGGSEIAGGSKGPRHGRHAASEPELSPRMKKSKRTRKVLIVLVILLLLVIGALCYFMFRTVTSSQHEAAQQAREQVQEPRDSIDAASAADAADSTTRLADVPDLAGLLGLTQDEAIEAIGHGALVTSNREVNEEGNPVKASLNVALTEEAADSKTGTPTVYLDLGEDGRVRQAGYSASAAALGFGGLSFSDAVTREHVVEKTLEKAGVPVPEGSAVLPESKADYTTYASDGTTIVRERCSFEGETDVNGVPCIWSSILSYDYTTQIVTGNLTDTVRIIYVYISTK